MKHKYTLAVRKLK